MANPKIDSSVVELFGSQVEEFCSANGVKSSLYHRQEADRTGLLRIEIDQKRDRPRERYQQVLRYPTMTHQRRQSNGEFDNSRWLGNPRTTEAAVSLYRAAIQDIIPPLHYELGWFQAMLAKGYQLDGPRPLWTYDVHPMLQEHIENIPLHFGLPEDEMQSTEDDCGDYLTSCHQRLLASRLELPYGTFIQDRLNNHFVTSFDIPDNVVGMRLGDILPVKKPMSSDLKVTSAAGVRSGTRLRIEGKWLAAAPVPETAFDWREPFILPETWTNQG